MSLKIVSIVGARPQFIKLSPMVMAAKALKDVHHYILHTGQHYDYKMNKVFFDELSLPEPQYNLEVGSSSHGVQTGQMLTKIEHVLLKEKPDWVLVYGDTNSTLAGALAAQKMHIPVAHIEAGLRSYNKKMPEEANRVMTDHISTILFCPTIQAVNNLQREGFDNVYFNGKLVEEKTISLQKPVASENNPLVINVGDVMYDAIIVSLEIAKKRSKIMEDLDLGTKDYFLATIHRPENTDDCNRLRQIIEAFDEIAINKHIIFPLHPRTKNELKKIGLVNINPKVRIIEPVGYFDMLILEKNADRIFTDSGGIQKEAYLLGIPCITLRDQTEWVETVNIGMNVLAGADKNKIIEASKTIFNLNVKFNAYGDGKAAARMLLTLKSVNIK